MMIPKTINYCWFGKKSLPETAKQNIRSWKKYNPEYDVVEWNESNFDIKQYHFIELAYNFGLFAFASDLARLVIIEQNGGIYCDIDVEAFRCFDTLLVNSAFFGLEDIDSINTGLMFGAVKHHPVLQDLIAIYQSFPSELSAKEIRSKTCVTITSDYFRSRGFVDKNRLQMVDECVIYPTEYFCPQPYGENKMKITKNTISTHHYASSWMVDTPDSLRREKSARVGRRIKKVLGARAYSHFYNVYLDFKERHHS